MDNNIISFAEKTGDATAWTPEQVVDCAKERLTTGDCKDVKCAMVIYLDADDGKYNTAYNQAGMSASECVALLEVVKQQFIRLIGEG